MMNLKLKIKIKSLVAETAIIRQEEHALEKRVDRRIERTYAYMGRHPENREAAEKVMDEHNAKDYYARDTIARHRVWDIGKEMRLSLVAYGFLNGKKYSEVENRVRVENLLSTKDWEAIEAMAMRFSGQDKRVIAQKLAEFGQSAGVTVEEDYGGRKRRAAEYQRRKDARGVAGRSKITTVDPVSGNSEGAVT